jgi:hypothetical protein
VYFIGKRGIVLAVLPESDLLVIKRLRDGLMDAYRKIQHSNPMHTKMTKYCLTPCAKCDIAKLLAGEGWFIENSELWYGKR